MEVFYVISIGGGGIFVVVFLLMILGGMSNGICDSISGFIENNAVGIGIVCGIILIITAVLAYNVRKGSVGKKISCALASSLALSQMLCGLINGIYGVANMSDQGFVIVIMGLVIYVVVQIISIGLTAFTEMLLLDDLNFPAYILAVVGWIFHLGFW